MNVSSICGSDAVWLKCSAVLYCLVPSRYREILIAVFVSRTLRLTGIDGFRGLRSHHIAFTREYCNWIGCRMDIKCPEKALSESWENTVFECLSLFRYRESRRIGTSKTKTGREEREKSRVRQQEARTSLVRTALPLVPPLN